MGKTGHTLSDLAWRSSVLFNTSCSINGGAVSMFLWENTAPIKQGPLYRSIHLIWSAVRVHTEVSNSLKLEFGPRRVGLDRLFNKSSADFFERIL